MDTWYSMATLNINYYNMYLIQKHPGCNKLKIAARMENIEIKLEAGWYRVSADEDKY